MKADTIGFNISESKAQGVVLEIKLEPQRTILGDANALLYVDEEISIEVKTENEVFEEPEEVVEEEEPILEEEEIIEEEEEEPPPNRPLLMKFVRAMGKTFFNPETEQMEIPPPPTEEPEIVEEEVEEAPPPPPYFHLTYFSNNSDYIRTVAFALPRYGKIFKVNLGESNDNTIFIQKGSLLCAARGTALEEFSDAKITLHKETEESLTFEKITGEGLAFLQAGGEIVQKKLQDDAIQVNLFSIIAYESGIDLQLNNIQKLPSLYEKHQIYLVNLSGTGRLWLQSHNAQQFLENIIPYIPPKTIIEKHIETQVPVETPAPVIEEPEAVVEEVFEPAPAPVEEVPESPIEQVEEVPEAVEEEAEEESSLDFGEAEAEPETPIPDNLDLDSLADKIEKE